LLTEINEEAEHGEFLKKMKKMFDKRCFLSDYEKSSAYMVMRHFAKTE
jgi:cell fate (sporulation/competence/biofilm development) regulator YmcA (YheA/YmcA/DUF963 family)